MLPYRESAESLETENAAADKMDGDAHCILADYISKRGDYK